MVTAMVSPGRGPEQGARGEEADAADRTAKGRQEAQEVLQGRLDPLAHQGYDDKEGPEPDDYAGDPGQQFDGEGERRPSQSPARFLGQIKSGTQPDRKGDHHRQRRRQKRPADEGKRPAACGYRVTLATGE